MRYLICKTKMHKMFVTRSQITWFKKRTLRQDEYILCAGYIVPVTGGLPRPCHCLIYFTAVEVLHLATARPSCDNVRKPNNMADNLNHGSVISSQPKTDGLPVHLANIFF